MYFDIFLQGIVLSEDMPVSLQLRNILQRMPYKYLKRTAHALSRGHIPVRMLRITLELLPKIRRITAYDVNVTYA